MIIFNYSITENTTLNKYQVTHPKKGFVRHFDTLEQATQYCIAHQVK